MFNRHYPLKYLPQYSLKIILRHPLIMLRQHLLKLRLQHLSTTKNFSNTVINIFSGIRAGFF